MEIEVYFQIIYTIDKKGAVWHLNTNNSIPGGILKYYLLCLVIVFVLTVRGCSNKTAQFGHLNKESSQNEPEGTSQTTAAPNTQASSKDYYTENNWNKKIINLQMADLTHDGTDDYIVTVIYVSPSITSQEASEMLASGGVGYVQVYDGSSTFGLDELGTLLWEKEFAAAHAGNTQINVVHRDGLDYLMPTDIYVQMGNYYFHYEVLYLDEKGNQYIAEEKSLTFNTYDKSAYEQRPLNNEEKQEITKFKEQMTTWFEGATLLVAADVNLAKQLVSTPRQQYNPEDYYEDALAEYIS